MKLRSTLNKKVRQEKTRQRRGVEMREGRRNLRTGRNLVTGRTQERKKLTKREEG